MDPRALETLWETSRNGDMAALEEVFLTYEPYLRTVVYRQMPARLRSKFDPVDVVQSVWADLLDGLRQGRWRFESPSHLKGFLTKMARHRLLEHIRRHGNAARHEQSLEATEGHDALAGSQPKPSQFARANELWDRLWTFCPPAHRQLLQLKIQGLGWAEIAAQTGLHEGSVRRIFYELARKLFSTKDR